MKTNASAGLSYTATEAAQERNESPDLSGPEPMALLTRHTFPAGISWAPEKMDINGRKGRRVMCVVAQDMTRYRTYDVDGNVEKEISENDKDNESDDSMPKQELG